MPGHWRQRGNEVELGALLGRVRLPIGGKVELMFLKTEATGQKVPEWRLVG